MPASRRLSVSTNDGIRWSVLTSCSFQSKYCAVESKPEVSTYRIRLPNYASARTIGVSAVANVTGGKVLKTLRTACAIAAILAMTACSEADSTPEASSAYTPPRTETAADGWSVFVDAPMVDRAAAENLDPKPDSPEAAVVKFLASRVRGDDAWRAAMVSKPSDRAKRALAEWDEWQLQRFQLRGRKEPRANEAYIKVFFEISVNGDTDDGEDEFEVMREGDEWRISRPPS